jgi:hypothetical protein
LSIDVTSFVLGFMSCGILSLLVLYLHTARELRKLRGR